MAAMLEFQSSNMFMGSPQRICTKYVQIICITNHWLLTTNFFRKTAPTQKVQTTGTQHTLRVFMQCRDWVLLQSQSSDSSEYGWSRSSGTLKSIGFFANIVPKTIINFTIYNRSTEIKLTWLAKMIYAHCSCRGI